MDLKKQMEKGLRSVKYSVKYGTAFNVPNPIRRGKEVRPLVQAIPCFSHTC